MTSTSRARARVRFAEVPSELLGTDEANRQALLLRLRIHSFHSPDDLLAEEAIKELVRRHRAGEPPSLDDSVRTLAKMLGLAPLMLLKMANDVADWVEQDEAAGAGDRAALGEDTVMQDEEDEEEEEEWIGPTPDHEKIRVAGEAGSLSFRLEDDAERWNAAQAGAVEVDGPSASPPASAMPLQPDVAAPLAVIASEAGAASQYGASTAAIRQSLVSPTTQQQSLRTPSGTQHRSASALLAEMEREAIGAGSASARVSPPLGTHQGVAVPTSSGSAGNVFHSSQPSQRGPPATSAARVLASQVLQQQGGPSPTDDESGQTPSRSSQPRVVQTTLSDLNRYIGIPSIEVPLQHAGEPVMDRSELCGFTHGSMLEVTGPTGSGKTCFVVQMGLRFRFDALVAAAADSETGDGRGWEGVVEGAASVWMIDTEGSLLPSRLHDDAMSFVASLSPSDLIPFQRFFDNSAATAPIKDEVVLALLAGISLSRALTLAELIAHLALAFHAPSSGSAHIPGRFTDERNRTTSPHTTASLVIIDSLSHHLRTPSNETGAGNGGAGGVGSGNERGQMATPNEQQQSAAANARREATRQREERKQAIDTIRLLGQTLDRWRRNHRHLLRHRTQALQRPQQDGANPLPRPPTPTPPPTLVTTMQMSTKLFSRTGELSNYRSASAVGRLVPSLVGPLPSASQEGQRRGAGYGDDDELYMYGGEGGRRRRGNAETPAEGPRDDAEAAMQHGERGSVLGKEAWRVMLFREREGSRFAQIQGRPPYANKEQLSPFVAVEADGEDGADEGVGELGPYAEGDTTWRTWVRFDVDSRGRIVEVPLTGG